MFTEVNTPYVGGTCQQVGPCCVEGLWMFSPEYFNVIVNKEQDQQLKMKMREEFQAKGHLEESKGKLICEIQNDRNEQ